jgi:hypothetical protein
MGGHLEYKRIGYDKGERQEEGDSAHLLPRPTGKVSHPVRDKG